MDTGRKDKLCLAAFVGIFVVICIILGVSSYKIKMHDKIRNTGIVDNNAIILGVDEDR